MDNKFDVGVRVKIKNGHSEHADEQGMIIRMGLGKAKDPLDANAGGQKWVVDFAGIQEEFPEEDLEII